MSIAECKNSKKYWDKSIGVGISSTFCQSIIIGIDFLLALAMHPVLTYVNVEKLPIFLSWCHTGSQI